jgi:hypothetical protein
MASRVAPVMLLTILVLAVGCGDDEAPPPSSASPLGPAVASTDSDEAEGSGRCDFPSFRPTYLPWLAPGEAVPAPGFDRFAGYAQLEWHAGNAYVVLWRVSDVIGGPGDPAPALPNGAEGYLYEGSSDEHADWAVVWADVQADGCNETTLSVVSRRLTEQEGKDAILRIAATLEEAP